MKKMSEELLVRTICKVMRLLREADRKPGYVGDFDYWGSCAGREGQLYLVVKVWSNASPKDKINQTVGLDRADTEAKLNLLCKELEAFIAGVSA